MEDPQLELADVKSQYLEAEAQLKELAVEVQGAASARQTLGETGESVANAANSVAATASDLADLSERLATAARAIEQAEPGAVRDRLNDVDASLEKVTDSIADLQRVQTQTRLLVILTLLALLGVVVLTVVFR